MLEIAFVVVIVAVLVSFGVAGFSYYSRSAKVANLKTSLSLLREAIDKYKAFKLRYPKKLKDLIGYGILDVPVEPFSGSKYGWELHVATTGIDIWVSASEENSNTYLKTYGFDDVRSSLPEYRGY